MFYVREFQLNFWYNFMIYQLSCLHFALTSWKAFIITLSRVTAKFDKMVFCTVVYFFFLLYKCQFNVTELFCVKSPFFGICKEGDLPLLIFSSLTHM